MSLIQGVWDGQGSGIPEEDQVDGLATQLAGSTVGNQGGTGSGGRVAGAAGGSGRPAR
jgi:hypothetical protein